MLHGLDYLHADCGLIHTDLKPENVMLRHALRPRPVHAAASAAAAQATPQVASEPALPESAGASTDAAVAAEAASPAQPSPAAAQQVCAFDGVSHAMLAFRACMLPP